MVKCLVCLLEFDLELDNRTHCSTAEFAPNFQFDWRSVVNFTTGCTL